MIDPVIFRVGFLQVTWYALVYLIGFLAVLYLLLKAAKKGEIGLDEGEVYDLVAFSIIGVIVGARLFHVLFWGFDYYFANFVKIFFIWGGGLSFHGGLVGISLAVWLYARKKGVSVWKIADIVVLPAVLFLALGRVANFVNQEIVGTVTNLSWCVNFRYDEGCRHPVQVYGAIGRFALFMFLIILDDFKKLKDGFLFWTFILLLGVGRFLVDFLREDVLHYGLKSGQWLSLVMIVVGGYVLWKWYW